VCDIDTAKILVNEEKAKAHWGAIVPREKKTSGNCHSVLVAVSWAHDTATNTE
jgi:hypothetical protein